MRRSHRLQGYLDERCAPIPEHLIEVERNTYLKSLSPQMLTGHMQGRFLAWLVEWIAPKQILEIGTFTAYSALCFAERLPKGGLVTTIEINDQQASIIQKHIKQSGFEQQIKSLIGDANQIIPKLKGPFDLVYLDAKKDDYPAQFELIKKLLSPNGYVLFDNVLWDGQVIDPDTKRATALLLREFTLSIANDPKWETLMLPMSDGLMLARKL